MSKDMFIEAHNQLIEKYLESHPEATEAQAYDITADGAWDKMVDNYADLAASLRKREKEQFDLLDRERRVIQQAERIALRKAADQ